MVPPGSMKQMVAAFSIARGQYWWFGEGWGPRTCVSNSSLPFPYDSLRVEHITWSARFKLLGGDSSHGVFRRVFEHGSLNF